MVRTPISQAIDLIKLRLKIFQRRADCGINPVTQKHLHVCGIRLKSCGGLSVPDIERFGITMVSICAGTWVGRPLLKIVEGHAFHRATVFDESPGAIPEPENGHIAGVTFLLYKPCGYVRKYLRVKSQNPARIFTRNSSKMMYIEGIVIPRRGKIILELSR